MAEPVKDPVCGMEVDPETAPAKSEQEGTTYYFCAEACKAQFDADPGKYVGGAPTAEAAAEGPSRRWWEFWKQ
jgi:YHS domain-containing protein